MILTIASRELRSLFLSPLAWSILAVLQAILAWLFLVRVDQFMMIQARLTSMPGAPGVTDIAVIPLFSIAGVLLLVVMPLITMRLISEEHRNKTLPLLMTSPISTANIILGKFLATLAFAGIIIMLILLMAFSIGTGTQLDYGRIAVGTLGLLLLISAFIAIGLYISCLTRHPTVAAVITFGILFMLWIIHWTAQNNDSAADILAWLSIIKHQESFYRGLISLNDAAYYIIVSTLFLLLSIRRLDAERLQS